MAKIDWQINEQLDLKIFHKKKLNLVDFTFQLLVAGYYGAFISIFGYFLFFENPLETLVVIIPYLKKKKKKKGTTNKQKFQTKS